jgi:hypothetical protein
LALTDVTLLEQAMLKHLWQQSKSRPFDLTTASHLFPTVLAEGQPLISQKWSRAPKMLAFNTLLALQSKRPPLVKMLEPAKAPRYVPKDGFWYGLWQLTEQGVSAANPYIGSTFDSLLGEDAMTGDE